MAVHGAEGFTGTRNTQGGQDIGSAGTAIHLAESE